MMTSNADSSTDVSLTKREMECLELMVNGFSSKNAAEKLGVSTASVDYHVANAVKKLEAKNRPHAAALAITRGLVHLNTRARGKVGSA